MDNPSRHIRLFDVQKYREIQPVIEGIKNRDAKVEEVVPLLEAAKNIAETEDFIKYNGDEIMAESSYLQNTILKIQTSGISSWFNALDKGQNRGYDITEIIFSFICCPDYQYSTNRSTYTSGTTINYEDVYFSSNVCDLGLFDLLNSSDYAERLPTDLEEFWVISTIFSPAQLKEINRVVKQDNLNLSKLKLSSDKSEYTWQKKYLEFYTNFNFLLKRVNSHPKYTLLNEDHLIAF
jgi:hypothetical protein